MYEDYWVVCIFEACV